MNNYNNLSDSKKKQILEKEYCSLKKSFGEIASLYNTYSNKLRRDAIKFGLSIRSKSDAQKNALSKGVAKHPTKGKERSITEKNKIGLGVMKNWEELPDNELQKRKNKAKENWDKLSDDTKANMINSANAAVRVASKVGSKLEKCILENLLADGYKVDFHKEQMLSNTKLQIDIFLPEDNIAIEVDGPSHYEPVWGDEALKRNKSYDNKKTGLILGKGLVLIRIKQIKDFSPSRGRLLYDQLKTVLVQIKEKFPDKDNRYFELGE